MWRDPGHVNPRDRTETPAHRGCREVMLTPVSHRFRLSAVYAEQRDQEFAWTAEHRQLRETVRAVLADRQPVSRARELAVAGARHDPRLWTALATDIGLQGLALPEEHGGSGATLVDLAVVAD